MIATNEIVRINASSRETASAQCSPLAFDIQAQPCSVALEGDEAVHCILDVMAADAPYTVLQRTMHIHPTVAELIPTLLGDLRPLV